MNGWVVFYQSKKNTHFHGVFLNESDAIDEWVKLRDDDGPTDLEDDYYVEYVVVHNKLEN